MHPTPVFDMGYIRLFRLLEDARPAVVMHTRASVPPSCAGLWPGQCTPRLFLLFQGDDSAHTEPAKLQQALQQQVSRILRHSGLVSCKRKPRGTDSQQPTRLFHLDQDAPYAFVLGGTGGGNRDTVARLLDDHGVRVHDLFGGALASADGAAAGVPRPAETRPAADTKGSHIELRR